MNGWGGFEYTWFGALYVELRGDETHSVITDLHRKGVVLRQIQYGQSSVRLVFGLRDFDTVYTSCRHFHVRIRFLERLGLPFLLKRLLRRKTMLMGPVLFFAIIYGLSSTIWQISISGVKEDTVPAVRQAAAKTGLYTGAWKGLTKGRLEKVQDSILNQVPSLIWVGVDVRGSKATIKAIEKIKGVDEKSTQPHNIVASKPAVIQRVLATRGQVLVKPGQVVHSGEVIISGAMGDGAAQVPAAGKVMAEVWYTSDVTVPLKVARKGLTGSKYKQDYLMIGGLGLHLWGWKTPHYAEQLQTTESTSWHLGKYQLPLQWSIVTHHQVQKLAFTDSEKAAKAKAIKLAEQDVRSKIGSDGSLLSKTVLHTEVSRGKLYAKVWIRAEEDIGVAKPIPQQSEDKTKTGNQPTSNKAKQG
ncbi:sporulation protein YqfD [Alicyclobacillus sp. SO9]|uniref:sporulation protein YqfD n=1 Tax=Alicyclobacillus sp. SO9 TaxID=2665646 RepID=UPI0018E745BB|nr:sporulation protein YqfD [Alicyclobacillus sp. SO9]QQE77335.1 sporulation protein YqfD [Alicyclobacillus sp. SO9]